MLKLISLLSLVASSAFANDGFYAGAGSTLTPVNNDKLQVLREDLEITAISSKCYELLFDGKPAKDLKQDPPSDALGTIGKKVACKKGKSHFETLETKFHAKAVYNVKALADVNDVQMGFPVPSWSYEHEIADGLSSIEFPGVINFKTTINGSPVEKITTKRVKCEETLFGNKQKDCSIPTFVWNANFKANTEYTLTTEYDFGYDESATFSTGKDMPEGKALWWDKRSVAEGFSNLGDAGPSESMYYFLHPIKSWAKPAPQEIAVRVEAPKGVPVTYLVSATPGLDCVDSKALYFNWKNDYPSKDLIVSYPKDLHNPRSIHSRVDFEAWVSLLGAITAKKSHNSFTRGLKVSCELIDKNKKTSDKGSLIFTWYKPGGIDQCVKSCR